ncbi:hypothetical protein [Pseudopedobacter beijingensis]|uniref:Uncharacterized protein n=1 Tax=Pseudopedobacter beijingensis TaxID=1207056 RepID=A0ABW4IE70_9SPHI
MQNPFRFVVSGGNPSGVAETLGLALTFTPLRIADKDLLSGMRFKKMTALIFGSFYQEKE